MSQANVDLVRALIPGPEVDIAALIRDDIASAALVAGVGSLVAPDFECVIAFPGARNSYAGVDGLRKGWIDWLEPYDSYATEIEELIDCGDRVLALVRDRGIRSDVNTPIELRGAALWTITDGLVRRIVFYGNREEAVADAGIDAADRRAPASPA